jgi:hypothetical protein
VVLAKLEKETPQEMITPQIGITEVNDEQKAWG